MASSFAHRSRSWPGLVAAFGLTVTLAACGSSVVSPSPSAGASTSAAPSGPGLSPGASATAGGAGGAPGSSAAPSGTLSPLPVDLGALQQRFVQIVHAVNPSVVEIQTDQGLGSGVIFDSQGDILTNAHVAAGATSFTVTLSTGRSMAATLVGAFALDDVAVIRVHASGLHPATFGNSASLQVGDLVMALGNPLGLQSSVTEGIVSALGRVVSEPAGNSIPDVIQTSAAINPGNSGGALVDLEGQVVGIPTLAASDPQLGGAAAGIGFAISSAMATDIARQLIEYGHVVNSHRAYLGIEMADTGTGQGVVIVSVQPGSPAAAAGLQAGDLITAVNGQPTTTSGALSGALATVNPGQTVKLSITRADGTQATVSVVVGQYPG